MLFIKKTFNILFLCYSILCISCSDESTSPNKDNNSETVSDIDGNIYKIVKIANQVWMAENLKVAHYRNGDTIPNVTDNIEWTGLSSGAYCVYDNDSVNVETYGFLYNWYAVDDARNIAPEGWHIPTDEEWKALEMHLGMSLIEVDDYDHRGTDEGGKLKEAGTTHWNSPNTSATNESGITALPGGYRRYDDGSFEGIGNYGGWWSATEYVSTFGWYRSLSYSRSTVHRYYLSKPLGISVRCVRD